MAKSEKLEVVKTEINGLKGLNENLKKALSVVESENFEYQLGDVVKKQLDDVVSFAHFDEKFEKESKARISEYKTKIDDFNKSISSYEDFFFKAIPEVNKLIKQGKYKEALLKVNDFNCNGGNSKIVQKMDDLKTLYTLFLKFKLYEIGNQPIEFLEDLHQDLCDIGNEEYESSTYIDELNLRDKILDFLDDYHEKIYSREISIKEFKNRNQQLDDDLYMLADCPSNDAYVKKEKDSLNAYLKKLIDKIYYKEHNVEECKKLLQFLHETACYAETDDPAFDVSEGQLELTLKKLAIKDYDDDKILSEAKTLVQSYRYFKTNKTSHFFSSYSLIDFFIDYENVVYESLEKYMEFPDILNKIVRKFKEILTYSEYLMFLRVLLHKRASFPKTFDARAVAKEALISYSGKKASIISVCYFGEVAHSIPTLQTETSIFAKSYFSDYELYVAAKRSGKPVIKDFIEAIYGYAYLPMSVTTNKDIYTQYYFGTFSSSIPTAPSTPSVSTSYSSSATNTSYRSSSSSSYNSNKTPKKKRDVSPGLFTAGVIFLFLSPIIGFILIVASIAKGDK